MGVRGEVSLTQVTAGTVRVEVGLRDGSAWLLPSFTRYARAFVQLRSSEPVQVLDEVPRSSKVIPASGERVWVITPRVHRGRRGCRVWRAVTCSRLIGPWCSCGDL